MNNKYAMKFLIENLESKELIKKNLNKIQFNSGDIITVKYFSSLTSKKKNFFTGICIGIKNMGIRTTFRIRSFHETDYVEQIFSLYSPLINQIFIKERKQIRSSKLYYLRLKKLKYIK